MEFGIAIAKECKAMFELVQREKIYRYIIFHINEEVTVKVIKLGLREADYDNFLSDLLSDGPKECRFAVYDYAYRHISEGNVLPCVKEKLFLMMWCPVRASIQDKMLYSCSFLPLKRELGVNEKSIQATDMDELSRECVEDQLRCADNYESFAL